jgi:RHS repeat-associated protein
VAGQGQFTEVIDGHQVVIKMARLSRLLAITMGYDVLGRQTSQTDVWGLSLTMAFDTANNLKTITDSLGGTITNTVDAANRITRRQYSDTVNQLSVAYTYDAADEITGEARYADANGTVPVGTSAYGYNDAGRVTSIVHKDPLGNTLDGFNYTYDLSGRVATETSTQGPSRTYGYDGGGQVVSDGTNNYNWDQEGNRQATGYTTGTGNELSSDGTWNYSYDAAGEETQKVNIANGQVWQYGYDNAARLVKAEHKPSAGGSVDERIQFKYDALGNRIEKDVDLTGTGTAVTTTRFANDPNGNAWADLDGNHSNLLQTRRLYRDAVDALFARIGSAGTAWYLDDRLGSIRDIAGATGLSIDHRDWGTFGNLTNETLPANGDRYGWTGRETDTELALQYNRARYYDPSTGRWMSQDPLGFDAGDSNLYRYVQNAPTRSTDPSGLAGEFDDFQEYQQYVKRMQQKARGTILSFEQWKGPPISNSGNVKQNPLPMGSTPIVPAAKQPAFDLQAAKRFEANPDAYTQLGPTSEWESGMKSRADNLYTFIVVTSMVVPGWQAGTLFLVPIDIANDNPGAALGNALPGGLVMLGRMRTGGQAISGGLGGPGTRAMRNSNEWILSAADGAARPNVPVTYVGNLQASSGLLAAQSAAGIEIQTGLPRLVELAAIRHEYAHQVLSRYSSGLADVAYHNSNYFTVLEELGVHLYATQNPAKAVIHSLGYVKLGQLATESAALGGGAFIIYRMRNNAEK